MKRMYIPVSLALFLLVWCSAGLCSNERPAVITWYSGGAANISLRPITATVDYQLHMAGTTRMKTLMLKLARKGVSNRQITIPLDRNGRFDVVILLKDSPGNYTVTLFGSPRTDSLSFSGIGYFKVNASRAVPADLPGFYLNDKVLAYVHSVMGKTVGRGECWDLAQEALDRNGADWTRPVRFGLALNPNQDEIKPGDIIQFKTVKLETTLPGGGRHWETLGLPDHTAVIYAVLGPRQFKLAHQNVGGKRFVRVTEINLNNMTSGRYWIYRPVAGMVFP